MTKLDEWLEKNKVGEQAMAVDMVCGTLSLAKMVAEDEFGEGGYTPADVIALAAIIEATRRHNHDLHNRIEDRERNAK